MSETDEKPFNQEKDPAWNREPGIVRVPGSNFIKEVAKFEQFHSSWTIGTVPGNPYVYRPFPKMLYRAEQYNGAVKCMASAPDPYEFGNPRELERAEESARRFTEKCQRIVKDEREMQRAMEDGWRESPQEAVDYMTAKLRGISQATAERNYADRNMSEPAKREVAAAEAEVGGEHLPEIAEKPKRRGRPRKVQPPAA